MDKHDKDQVANDDQELANVLAEVTGTGSQSSTTDDTGFIEPPLPTDGDVTSTTDATDAILDSSPTNALDDQPLVPTPPTPMPEPIQPPMPAVMPDSPVMASEGTGDLDSIKQQAISELRPLVDKLNVSPEEKFDTLLLLIRSTDDRELIAPAHQAAREIMDESRKAKALLDIIKEVDYLSNKQ